LETQVKKNKVGGQKRALERVGKRVKNRRPESDYPKKKKNSNCWRGTNYRGHWEKRWKNKKSRIGRRRISFRNLDWKEHFRTKGGTRDV